MSSPSGTEPGFAHLKLLILPIILLLLAAAVWRAEKRMHSMAVVAESAKDVQQAQPDTKTKMVVEVVDAGAGALIHATLLEKTTEELYTRTQTSVTAEASSNTKMVMGKREDVHRGAVVHITGTRGSDGRIEAEQIVILTGYVKVN